MSAGHITKVVVSTRPRVVDIPELIMARQLDAVGACLTAPTGPRAGQLRPRPPDRRVVVATPLRPCELRRKVLGCLGNSFADLATLRTLYTQPLNQRRVTTQNR